jgi:hypothetical protein
VTGTPGPATGEARRINVLLSLAERQYGIRATGRPGTERATGRPPEDGEFGFAAGTPDGGQKRRDQSRFLPPVTPRGAVASA